MIERVLKLDILQAARENSAIAAEDIPPEVVATDAW